MSIYTKYLGEADDFDTVNILVDVLSPEISELIYRLMQEHGFLLLPMAFAANEEIVESLDCEWPTVNIMASAAAMHDVLTRGPYHWWKDSAANP